MKRLFRNLLFLKKGEQRALFVVGFLLLLSLAIRVYIPLQQYPASNADDEFISQVDILKGKIDSMSRTRESIAKIPKIEVKDLNPFPFDPNTVTKSELEKMNFPSRVLLNILSYRRAGGNFFSPEDMRKIYGMDSTTFMAIESSILIKQREQKSISWYLESTEENKHSVLKFELNRADSIALIQINGIGPVFSGRIIKYRNLLGAYYSIDQLWEVYGMDSLKYESLKDALYIDTTHIQKININTASFKKMISHPYLERKEVMSLIHYRDYAGEIKDIAELRSSLLIDSVRYKKIMPYLKCETVYPTPRMQSAHSAKN